MISQGARFIFHFQWKTLWHKWQCYGLFYSGNVNKVLLYAMFGSLVSTYSIMRLQMAPNEVEVHWHQFFANNGVMHVVSSAIVYYYTRDSRNAGLATIWMLYMGATFHVRMLGLDDYVWLVDKLARYTINLLSIYIIYEIFQKSNAKRTAIRRVPARP